MSSRYMLLVLSKRSVCLHIALCGHTKLSENLAHSKYYSELHNPDFSWIHTSMIVIKQKSTTFRMENNFFGSKNMYPYLINAVLQDLTYLCSPRYNLTQGYGIGLTGCLSFYIRLHYHRLYKSFMMLFRAMHQNSRHLWKWNSNI